MLKTIIRKRISDSLSIIDTCKIKEIIIDGKYGTVSFDIFDTLVIRNVRKPEDIFDLMEKQYNEYFSDDINVAKIRIMAQKKAYEHSKFEDVNIEDIYEQIDSISEEKKQWLHDKEIELEKLCCVRNEKIGDLYDWCLSEGKRIIITSDMYLPVDILSIILENAGYEGWNNIYASGERHYRKSTGRLFDIVLQEEKLLPKDIIHIGDAIKGDYLKPKSRGIDAVILHSPSETKYINRNVIKSDKLDDRLEYGIINTFIKNSTHKEYNYYQNVGYEVIGPMLYGFTKWITKKSDADDLFFLAREGYLLNSAFNLYNNSSKATVIKVSRRATTIPLLNGVKEIDALLSLVSTKKKNISVCDLLYFCGIHSEYIVDKLIRNGFSIDDHVAKMDSNNKQGLYNLLEEYLKSASICQEENIRGYFEKDFKRSPIFLVDIGWHGTIQRNLSIIFKDLKFKGLYLGQKGKLQDIESEAFLFDDSANSDIKNDVMSSVGLFELFFLSVDGSALSYERDEKGSYYCRQEEAEQTEETAQRIIELQQAALEFITDFSRFEKHLDLKLRPHVCAAAYSVMIKKFSQRDIHKFEDFSFLNGGKQCLSAKHSIWFYVIHPKLFYEEFANSVSKAFFLQSLFKVPLPYVTLVSFFREHFL